MTRDRHPWRRVLVATVWLSVGLGLDAAHAAEPPVVQEVTSTEAEQGVAGVRGVRATFDVAAPPDLVLETLWNVDRFLEMYPDIDRLTVKRRTATEVDAEFGIKVMLGETAYVLRRKVDRRARRVWWREIGGDLKTVRGEWRVEPTADPAVSRVTYLSFVDIGRFVPDSLVRSMAKDKVDALADRVRAVCEATYKRSNEALNVPPPTAVGPTAPNR